MSAADPIAVVVVTHDSSAHVPLLLTALLEQLRPDDELVVVDNASRDGTVAMARHYGDRVRVIETGANLGFGGGCHIGAEATQAPLLLFLNPDSQPQEDCIARLRAAAAAHPGWGAWQAVVLLPDGRINTNGGIVHYLGMGWSGDCGAPATALQPIDYEVPFPSGAALVVRRSTWDQLGGLDRSYFLYGEDLDLGLRLWLAGSAVGVVPEARVVHSYEFDKGPEKWFWLERNRWRTVLTVYPGRLLALLAPALLGAELVLLAVAAREGWLSAKLRAEFAVVRELPAIVRRRRAVQAARRLSTAAFAAHLTAGLDSAYLPVSDAGWPSRVQSAYWSLVRRLIGAGGP